MLAIVCKCYILCHATVAQLSLERNSVELAVLRVTCVAQLALTSAVKYDGGFGACKCAEMCALLLPAFTIVLMLVSFVDMGVFVNVVELLILVCSPLLATCFKFG